MPSDFEKWLAGTTHSVGSLNMKGMAVFVQNAFEAGQKAEQEYCLEIVKDQRREEPLRVMLHSLLDAGVCCDEVIKRIHMALWGE